jgi:C4-dicarboxylate transporter DctM subunit
MILLVFAVLFLILLTGIPIFTALGLAAVGLALSDGVSLSSLAEIVFGHINVYSLIAIPLFAFMAHVLVASRIMDDLFAAAHALTRHLPGGLAVATILSCTMFSAVSGSSVATALTVGASAIPQMKKFGYRDTAAYGAVAGGGALGILIPPSGAMVLYAVVANASIGALFIAGILPGLMLSALFAIWCMVSSRDAPREKAAALKEMAAALRRAVWALLLPPLVLGGIYLGIFTATEAAGMGTIFAILIGAFIYRTVGVRELFTAAVETARISTVLFLLVAGASIFSFGITRLRLPLQVLEAVNAMGLNEVTFFILVMAVIFVLGMFLEGIAIILLTTPMVLPAIQYFDVNVVWYGIILMINLELAMITPPVGMNLFVVKSLTGAPLATIIRGSAPYVVLMLIGMALIFVFPQIALFLPQTAGFR